MSEITETEIKSMTKEQNYMRGYRDGKSDVLDKISAEIKQEIIPRNSDQYDYEAKWQNMGLRMALKVIDKKVRDK